MQLTVVDEVIIFDNLNPTNLINKIKPNIVVRGSEFTADQVRQRDNIPNDIKVKIFPIKRGYSKAVLDGVSEAKGDFILCTDGDNQIKVESLLENINNLPKKNEFIFGTRHPRNDPLNRIFYSKKKIMGEPRFPTEKSTEVCSS